MAQQALLTPNPLSIADARLVDQFMINAYFVDNLRKQSNKIEEILAYVERLKAEISLKDKLIQELKRKQGDWKIQMLRIQESLTIECEGRIKMTTLRSQQLQETINLLTAQNTNLHLLLQQHTTQPHQLSSQLRILHSQQIQDLHYKLQTSKSIIEKWKQKYNACKEECVILHGQLANQRKIVKELEGVIYHAQERHGFVLQEQQFRSNRVVGELAGAVRENCGLKEKNCKLEQHLRALEDQLARQIAKHENQIKDVLGRISKFEANELLWKHKYYELQATVNQVQEIRANMRVQRNLEAAKLVHCSEISDMHTLMSPKAPLQQEGVFKQNMQYLNMSMGQTSPYKNLV